MNALLVGEFNQIINKLEPEEKTFMQEVYSFSEKAHEGQKRKSGEKYFNHPLAVGINLYNKFGDIELFAAGLLHDTSEDNENIPISEIYNKFGENVGYLVDSVTKTTNYFHGKETKYPKKIDKFLDGGLHDIRCYILKLADREDNLKTLENLRDVKQVRMAFETQAIFTPLESYTGYKIINNIEEGKQSFNKLITSKNIKGYLELKDYLINKTFRNFSNECFDRVYQNTDNVTWKITNKEVLDTFLEIPNIDDKIEIVSMEHTSSDEIMFYFKFKKGEIIDHSIKLEIGNLYGSSNNLT